MLYRKFGKTNQTVSALGFGCMRLPVIDGNYSSINKDEAIRIIRYAIDNGVNYLDTAYPYHGTGLAEGGNSEPLLAEALKDGYRQKVFIATKLPCWLINTHSDMDRYLNKQLERLQTDHIDFYLAHALGKHTWNVLKENSFEKFFDRAIADGRIRYAGFSFHDSLPLFKEIVDGYDWSFCQIQYNYMDENFQAGTEGLRYAAERGLGVAIMEPLRGGSLANIPQEIKDVYAQSSTHRTPADWGYSWVLNHPEVSVVLSGMNTMEQVNENLMTASKIEANALTSEELNVIEQAKNIFNEKIKVTCTACEYCMPCPNGVSIPNSFSYYNSHSIFGIGTYGRPYKDLFSEKERASNCVGCGLCESHCPQGIKIISELKKIASLFEQ